ncbi:MAG: amidohydrolase family protein [Bacteroidetes bacterium]|nr:amidohydrolase family protein [Bacteroidota bacterium]
MGCHQCIAKRYEALELAPTNASQLEKAGIAFCFTTDGLKDKKDFMRNIRKALDNGLSEQSALKALTYTPAVMLNIQNKTGSIKKGMVANFIITSKSIFDKENVIFENWCNGKRYIIKNINAPDLRGYYTLFLNNKKAAGIRVTGEMDGPQIFFDEDTNKTKGNISFAQEQLLLSYESKNAATKGLIKLNGYIDQATKTWKGSGYLQNGQWTNWYTVFDSTFIATAKIDSAKKDTIKNGNLWLPNMAYGWENCPHKKQLLLKTPLYGPMKVMVI